MEQLQTREELLAAFEQERAALLDVLPRFSDEQWRSTREDGWTAHDIAAHLADANYGLALMVRGDLPPPLPLDQSTGWMAGLDAYNQVRRDKNAELPREKVLSRSAKALEQARQTIEVVDDLDAPGPYGPLHTKRQLLQRIIRHTHDHRVELEQLLGG